MPQLTKAELASVVEQFTTNIEDRLINPHIVKTIEIGFENIIPQSLIDAIVAMDLNASGNDNLKIFYNKYFKQVWSYSAYLRFFTWHGNNITQFGLVNIVDDNTRVISDKVRGELINNIERDKQVYLTRMLNKLVAINYTIDGVSYGKLSTIKKPKNKFGIRPV